MNPQEEVQLTERQAQKRYRDIMTDCILVELDGVLYQGNTDSQEAINRALTVLVHMNLPQMGWISANNSVHTLDIAQLESLLALAGMKQSELYLMANAGILTPEDMRDARNAYEEARKQP